MPDYYEFIKLPVSIETIERKVKRNEYPTVTTLESDLKRMTQNAKNYNDPGSVIYEDAERIRKLVFNFMKVNNPAYKEDPKYTSFATPIPEEAAQPVQNGVKRSAERQEEKPKPTASARGSEQPDRKSSVAPSATTGDADGAEDEDEGGDAAIDFEGKSFQDAQQAIISHLLHYTDEE